MTTNKLTDFSLSGIMQVGCLFVLLFSVSPYLVQIYWYLENLSHFRFQYLLLSIVFFIYFVFLNNRIFIVISLSIFLINTVYIVPSYIQVQSSQNGAKRSKIKLFHSNVLTSNKHYSKLIEQVVREKPDVVLLQEVNDLWIANLGAIKAVYPYFIEQPQSDNFGIALYSKLPIMEHEIHHWTDFDLPSIEVELDLDGATFRLISTHPLPPINKYYYDQRNVHIKAIADRAKELDSAKIFIGDLNMSIWSIDYQTLESGTGLLNASKGFGFVPTWPTTILPLMIPIDHCLVSKHFNVIAVKSGESFGSDHLPLIVELEL